MSNEIVIIGNGIAGITCARTVRKANPSVPITIISSESDHFFSRTALMYIYMGHMRYEDTKPYQDYFWEQNNLNLVRDKVIAVDFSTKKLTTETGRELGYDKLVLAVGSKPRLLDWPGVNLEGIAGLYSLQDLEKLERWTPKVKTAVVVGGGLIGIELVEMLHTKGVHVHYLVRDSSFWSKVLPKEESEMVNQEILRHHIDLRLGTELKSFHSKNGKDLSSITTNKGEELPCEYAGIAIGVEANTAFLKDTEIELNRGILVDQNFETSVKDVFAIGDCAERRAGIEGRTNLEQVWYTGRMHGEVLGAKLVGKEVNYNPGPWFNSAKFFTIEYQVYGAIDVTENPAIKSLFWKDEMGKKSIRIQYSADSGEVTGFNLLGVRYRHEVCEKWLATKATIENVLTELHQANFDPEFFERNEQHLIDQYNRENNTNISTLKSRKKWYQFS